MNIAILIPELGGGGAEHMAKVLGEYYAARGENVFYFLGDFGVHAVYQVPGTVVKTHLPSLTCYEKSPLWFWRFMLWRHARVIRKLKKKYHIDCSVSYMEEFNYLNALSRCGDRVILRVCTMLSIRPELRGRFYDHARLGRVYAKADAVAVLGRDGVAEMREVYGVPEEKIVTLHHPNDIEESTEVPEGGWKYGPHAIICVGRLHPVKQQDRLIRAFRKVVEELPDAQLLFLGDGLLDVYLQGLCRMYRLEDHVHFLGYARNVRFYMSRARIFTMTSFCEGFPLVMAEAISCGTPVVATESQGGIHEILGYYEEPKPVPGWGEVLQKKGIQTLPYGIMAPRLTPVHHRVADSLDDEENVLAEALLFLLTHDEAHRWYSMRARERSADFQPERVMKIWNGLIYGKQRNEEDR